MAQDAQITQTYIGQEYGWDHLSDVDLDILRNNRESMMGVITNAHAFPYADFEKAGRMVKEIDAFMAEYGDRLVEFA